MIMQFKDFVPGSEVCELMPFLYTVSMIHVWLQSVMCRVIMNTGQHESWVEQSEHSMCFSKPNFTYKKNQLPNIYTGVGWGIRSMK